MKKRFICGLLSTAIAASLLQIVYAEDNVVVSMKGIFHQYETIYGDIKGNIPQNAEYSWLSSDVENGEYTEIPKSEYVTDNYITLFQGAETIVDNIHSSRTDDYYLTGDMRNSLSGKWIKYRVSANGKKYDSKPQKIDDAWIQQNTVFGSEAFSDIHETTPPENIFLIDGKEFILLDTTSSDSARFLVMAKDIYGITSKGRGQQLEYLAEYLSTDFKENGLDGKVLPKKITDAIDYNVYWKVGRPYWPNAMEFMNRYVPAVKTGIFVPSKEEVLKYSSKIGLQDENIDWMLRDPASGSSSDGNMMLFMSGESGGLGRAGMFNMETQEKGIRPIFYLSKSFFESKPCDFSSMGFYVKKAMIKNYTIDELISYGYSKTDVDAFVNGSVDELSIEGMPKVNETVKGTYKGNGINEKNVIMRWEYADAENGEYTYISEGKTLKLDSELSEKWVRFSIELGTGKIYTSKPVFVQSMWDDNFKGKVTSIKIKGVYEPYQELTMSYEMDSLTGEGDINYKKWYVSNAKGGVYTEIVNGRNRNQINVGTENADKWIKCEITLKNRAVYTSEPRKIGKLWNYTINQIDNSENNKFDTVNKITPQEYIFEAGGQEFILLDSTESETSAFMVMAKDTYGSRQFYTEDMQQRFDQMAEWLNSDFRVGGNGGKKLPDVIVKYIDYNQTWQTEAGRLVETKGYNVGIALPSITEIRKYSKKIGLQDSGESWWTRTPTGHDIFDGNSIFGIYGDEGNLGKTGGWHGRFGSAGIRPIFYLNKQYFLDNPPDLKTTGREALKQIGKAYEKDELRDIYDKKILEDVFGYEPDFSFQCFSLSDLNESADCLCLITNHYTDRSGTVVFCVYDKDNRLVGVDMKDMDFEKGKEKEIEFSIGGLPAGEGKTIQVYLVDKSEVMEPITYRGTVEY